MGSPLPLPPPPPYRLNNLNLKKIVDEYDEKEYLSKNETLPDLSRRVSGIRHDVDSMFDKVKSINNSIKRLDGITTTLMSANINNAGKIIRKNKKRKKSKRHGEKSKKKKGNVSEKKSTKKKRRGGRQVRTRRRSRA